MMEIRLKQVAERLGKNITEIAKETGLNRNSVTALYHGKVDGIKFSTVDVLCDTYGLRLEDLLVRRVFSVSTSSASRIAQVVSNAKPLRTWAKLSALHSTALSGGVGKISAYFVRDTAELYFSRGEANRFARSLYEHHATRGYQNLHEAFLHSQEQALALTANLSGQIVERFLISDILKTLQRLLLLRSDVLSASAWLDAFDFGVREELVQQVIAAHGLKPDEASILTSSGVETSAVQRRLRMATLARKSVTIEHRLANEFLREYPFVSSEDFRHDLAAYVRHPKVLTAEIEELSELTRNHARLVKDILRAHGMRANPLNYFAEIASWREERDETDRHLCAQIEKLMQVAATRLRITPELTAYVLPQEVEAFSQGLITEKTLRTRKDESIIIIFEHGEMHVLEGERATSLQDDLASRYNLQLSYGAI